MRPSSSFRLYPSGLLSLSLTFHNLMVLSGNQKGTLADHIGQDLIGSVNKKLKVLVDVDVYGIFLQL